MNGNTKWVLSGALAVMLGIAAWGLTSWASGTDEAIRGLQASERDHVDRLARIETILGDMRDMMRKEQH